MATAQRKKVGKARTTRAGSSKKPTRNSRGQFASKAPPLSASRDLRSYGRDDGLRRYDREREREPLDRRSERYADVRYARGDEPYARYADERRYDGRDTELRDARDLELRYGRDTEQRDARDLELRYGRDTEPRYGRDTEQRRRLDDERRTLRDDGYRYRREDERPVERRYDTGPEEEDLSWDRDRDGRQRDGRERANGRW